MANLYSELHDFWQGSNKNIKISVIYQLFSAVANSILWFSVTFMVYALGGANTDLGNLGLLATVFTLVSTLLAGWLSDKWKRNYIIYIGNGIGIIGILILSFANSILILFIGQFIMSVSFGIAGPVTAALIADSMKSKEMNRTYGNLFLVSEVFGAIGNIVSYFIFTSNGGQLTISTLLLTVRVAAVFFIFTSLVALYFVDPRFTSLYSKQQQGHPDDDAISKDRNFTMSRYQSFMVLAVLFANYLISFGAGISIPYIPKFFNSYYHLNLDDLSLVFAGMMIATGLWGKYMSDLAGKYGRIKMIVATQGFAAALLFLLSSYPPLFFAITTILVRNAAMNAAGPLVQALTFDNISTEKRGMYSSAASIGWTLFFGIGQGIGGRIIDASDFYVVFLITASLYTVATLLLLLLRDAKTIAK